MPVLPASARLSIRLLVTLATIVGASAVQAEDYPSRPVHIVVPYAAGGGTDAMARFIARGLEKKLGQPVIVDNRPGQGTAVGGTYVARAAPDGYTLLMATSSTLAMNPTIYPKLAYHPPRDFTPVALVAAVPFVLIVHPSLQVGTLDQLLRLARAKPGALSYGSGGAGSAHHVFMELVRGMTGVDIKHVPYRGGGPALTDVVAGHVPMMFADVGQALRAGARRPRHGARRHHGAPRRDHAGGADARRSRACGLRGQHMAMRGRARAPPGADRGEAQPRPGRIHGRARDQ